MLVVEGIPAVRDAVAAARADGRRIGFVPTMGYLHEGHLRLIDRSRQMADFVVVSIYVNPLQFGPNEDYDAYPRDLDRDLGRAEERGVDLVFTPDDDELYPEPPTVAVTPRRLADCLCGAGRPGHFEGVLTIVSKLFGIVQPDLAVFGHKDFQQSILVRRLVVDLNMPVRIEVAPTVRDPDGLALSSRNEYLSPEERSRALSISRGLADAVRAYRSGERHADSLLAGVRSTLERAGDLRIEYVECVSSEDLEPVQEAGPDAVIAVAVHLGETRLIDNVRLAQPDPDLERLISG